MIKRFVSIIIFAVFAFISSCSMKQDGTGLGDESFTKLRIVTNSLYHLLYMNSVGTDYGNYEALLWPDEIHASASPWIHIANILYTDYRTQTRMYLCNVPGCKHNNESCTSFIKFPLGVRLFSNSTQSMLFCMALGAEGGEIYTSDDIGRIYKMDMDGRNRKELVRLMPNESYSRAGLIAADETHIFVCVEVTNNALTKTVLRQINVTNGEQSDIHELARGDLLVSAYDDMILFERVTELCETIIYGFSINTKQVVELHKGPGLPLASEGKLFFITHNDDSIGLEIYDCTEKTSFKIEDLPKGNIQDADVGLGDFYENKVHWSFVERAEQEKDIDHIFIIDCVSGEFYEKTLSYQYEADGAEFTRFICIVAETDDSFLVLLNSGLSKITITDREGIPHIYDWPNREGYALISKLDYWNNKPNFQPIKETVGL